MGYKIIYPTAGKQRYPMKKKSLGRFLPISLLIAIFLAISLIYGSAGWMLPGDPEITAAALDRMVDNLAGGEAFGDAVTAFCREIIAGAG